MVTGPNEISEVREFCGGRVETLDFQHRRYPRQLDFFSIAPEFYSPSGVLRSARAMRRMATCCGYSYSSVFAVALRRFAWFEHLYGPGHYDDKANIDHTKVFCSQAVCSAYQYGWQDPVPNTPNALVTPADLSKSLMFEYRFSL
jgi:hypothetical protein